MVNVHAVQEGMPSVEGSNDDAIRGDGVADSLMGPAIESVSSIEPITESGVTWRFRRLLGARPFKGVDRTSFLGSFARLVGGATACLGAGGGDTELGTKSIIGRKRSSTLYCFANANPRSMGTQVPVGRVSGDLRHLHKHDYGSCSCND